MTNHQDIRKRARRKRTERHIDIDTPIPAQTVLAACKQATKLKRTPIATNNPRLANAQGALDIDAQAIYENARLSPQTASFVAAHLFGHFWLHGKSCRCENTDFREDEESASSTIGVSTVEDSSAQSGIEGDANLFAAELLLPTPLAHHLFFEKRQTASQIVEAFFANWYEQTLLLGNKHLTKVAQMLQDHLSGLLLTSNIIRPTLYRT